MKHLKQRQRLKQGSRRRKASSSGFSRCSRTPSDGDGARLRFFEQVRHWYKCVSGTWHRARRRPRTTHRSSRPTSTPWLPTICATGKRSRSIWSAGANRLGPSASSFKPASLPTGSKNGCRSGCAESGFGCSGSPLMRTSTAESCVVSCVGSLKPTLFARKQVRRHGHRQEPGDGAL